HPDKDYCLIFAVSSSSDDNSLGGMRNLAGKEKTTDQSLREMAVVARERGPQGLRANLRNKVDFDPFARTTMPWNKTAGGIDFVAVKGGQYGSFVFLAPAGGDLVRVGRVEAQRGRDGKPVGGWLQETPVLREFAMPIVEAQATKL